MAQTVVIATPAYITKKGISSIIDEIQDADLVYFDEINELNKFLEQNNADCIIIEHLYFKDNDNWDLLFQLKKDTPIVLLSENQNNVPASKQFNYIINRNSPKDKLVPVFYEILNQPKQGKSSSPLLSERETDVLKLVALGYTNQQIADNLFISKHTVISHRKNITSKLGIKTVSGLTVYAVLNNLIPKDQIQ
jgi:DNA-binding CsgD family transcriptional regulator